MVHKWRAIHDAVVVGAGTIRMDDPRLNVRLATGRNPHVVILDAGLTVAERSRVFRDRVGRRVILCTTRDAASGNRRRVERLRKLGVEVLTFRTSKDMIPLRTVCRRLYAENIGSVLVEGGSRVFRGFVSAGLIDQLSLFTAPFVMGSGIPAFGPEQFQPSRKKRSLERTSVHCLGSDVLLDYFFSPEE
jgi:riboflavin-specific deaminase-like protein